MSTDDKYYYIQHLVTDRRFPEVVKWNKDYTLSVEEDVDTRQYVDLIINKLHQKNIKPPGSDKYTKVKPVIKEIFLDHYELALKYISEVNVDDGEFYLFNNSREWFIVEFYSKDERQRTSISIDFRDSIQDLWLMLRCSSGFQGRSNARKKATAITDGQFKQFLNITLQFLYDPDSISVFLNDYLKNFKLLSQGETKIQGFIISAEKSVQVILDQLESRKTFLEKRLIENDDDSIQDRMKFRGELEGIIYAINAIRTTK